MELGQLWAEHCLPRPRYFSQGLSDFCSSPDTYLLNLTQEKTGLSSGDPMASVPTPPEGGWGCPAVQQVQP